VKYLFVLLNNFDIFVRSFLFCLFSFSYTVSIVIIIIIIVSFAKKERTFSPLLLDRLQLWPRGMAASLEHFGVVCGGIWC
jgi:hypothetical protein